MKNVSDNHNPSLSAESSISHQNENVYSTNHALDVNVIGGGSGSTQYSEGATTSPATGTVALGRYIAVPSTIADGALAAPLMDEYRQLKVVPVGTTTITGTVNQGTPAVIGNAWATKITDGTNTASVVDGDAGFDGVATASATKTLTFSTSASGAQTILANTNVEGYSWIEIVYTSVGSGLALTAQFSTVSGGTYVNSNTFGNGGAAIAALGTTVNTIYDGPIRGNFFQLAVSALSSGTFAGTVTLRNGPTPFTVFGSVQSGTWTMQPGNTANTTPWLANPRFSPSHISANTTTTAKSGAGTLHTIVINTKGITNTATVYDNTAGSGTILAVIDTTLSTTAFVYDVAFATGLTIVTAGGTPADLTVSYI